MALRSMTGYGRGEASRGGIRAEVELSSVNRKQFDLRLTLPRALASLEPRFAEIVRAGVSRGQCTGMVAVTASARVRQEAVAVDRPLAAAFVREIRRTAGALSLRDDLGASLLLQLPGVVQVRGVEDDLARIQPVCEEALRRAVRALVAMREREGRAIARDLRLRLNGAARRVRQIAKRAPTVGPRYRRLVLDRLRRAGIPAQSDDPSLLREIALLAERADISEELTRLESHLAQAAAHLGRAAEPAGRALDFLAQEMFREINTIGAKANDLAITKQVLAVKAELERFREQIQNVE